MRKDFWKFFWGLFTLVAVAPLIQSKEPPVARVSEPPVARVQDSTDPYGLDYPAFYRMIGNGIPGYLAVGTTSYAWEHTYLTHCRVESGFGGLADGLYKCYKDSSGKQVIIPYDKVSSATSGVVATRPFPPVESRTTQDTVAPLAAVASSTYPGSMATGRIRTLAPMMVQAGGINCSSPFG